MRVRLHPTDSEPIKPTIHLQLLILKTESDTEATLAPSGEVLMTSNGTGSAAAIENRLKIFEPELADTMTHRKAAAKRPRQRQRLFRETVRLKAWRRRQRRHERRPAGGSVSSNAKSHQREILAESSSRGRARVRYARGFPFAASGSIILAEQRFTPDAPDAAI